MTTINTLPTELLSIIFSKFDKLTHLAACRLVCKAWKDPAEREMLGHTITISADKMASLYAFLKIHTTRTHLIKHLHFGSVDEQMYEAFIIDLLELIAASGVESITGYVWEIDFFNIFTDVVESSPYNLDKLKTLTLSYGEIEPPIKLALHCRKSIETMKLDFLSYHYGNGIDWNFVDKLKEFQHLTTFTLTAVIGAIANLNRIIDNCPHLREFSLATYGWEYNSGDRLNLDRKAGQRHPTLKTLKIRDGDYSSFMIEYFLHKFINLEKITVDVTADIDFRSEAEIVRIIKLIERVPQREMFYTLEYGHDIPYFSGYMKRAGYTTIIASENVYDGTRMKVIL